RAIDSFIDHPGLTEQLLAVQGLTSRPWRNSGLSEAMGVPAIFRAVSLIANTTGALSLRAFRNGQMLDNEDRPRIIVRPNPLNTTREFFRDTAYHIATRGEVWWNVPVRDIDGSALALVVVEPHEIRVEANARDRFRPNIYWGDKLMPNEDMKQITWFKSGYRGYGPLQVCGAAISVAVESQMWAASFYAEGGLPSINLHSGIELTGDEALALKTQYAARGANTPFVTSGELELREIPDTSEGGQMLEARHQSKGDVANMFGIPGALLGYSAPGSSLTYQNVSGVMEEFVRGSLWPNVLEGVEQEISDLLSRSTVARFNVDALLRADIKTRFEVYGIGIDKGILDREEARRGEGLEPGDVENAPIPMSPPAAIPPAMPVEMRALQDWRCSQCGKKLAEAAGPGSAIRCKCGTRNEIAWSTRPPEPSVESRAITELVAALPDLLAAARQEPSVVNIQQPVRRREIITTERDSANNIVRMIRDEEAS
ncbi:MAG: phage portal protein, partial [Ilumatobacteraceae bacterium]